MYLIEEEALNGVDPVEEHYAHEFNAAYDDHAERYAATAYTPDQEEEEAWAAELYRQDEADAHLKSEDWERQARTHSFFV